MLNEQKFNIWTKIVYLLTQGIRFEIIPTSPLLILLLCNTYLVLYRVSRFLKWIHEVAKDGHCNQVTIDCPTVHDQSMESFESSESFESPETFESFESFESPEFFESFEHFESFEGYESYESFKSSESDQSRGFLENINIIE